MDTKLLTAAKKRGGVLLRTEMLELGYSSSAISRRIYDGFLVPVFPDCGAYVLGSTVIERRHRVVAAVALTPGALADRADAARLLGLLPVPTSAADRFRDLHEPIHIAMPTPVRSFVDGIHVRRQLHRSGLDVTRRFGVDVLSPERLVLDMAGRWPIGRVEHILDTGMSTGTLDIDVMLRRHLQLHRRGRKGVRVVDTLLETRLGRTQMHATKMERDTRALLSRAGLPEPISQYRVELPNGRYRDIDLAYPWVQIGIEVLGFTWHSSFTDWSSDQLRYNELAALGWLILRVTDETHANPSAFLAQLEELIRSRAAA